MGDPFNPLDPFSPLGPFGPILPIPTIPVIPPLEAPLPIAPSKRISVPAAAKFFLPPSNESDDMKFRGAVRDAFSVTPIIDGEAIFTELEKAVAAATSSVLMAFWSLDPEMKLVTDSGRKWSELLVEAANRGVKVRILTNDFDPMFQFEQHVGVWASQRRLQKAADGLSIDKLQIVCSHHPAESDPSIVEKIAPNIIDGIVANINATADPKVKTLKFVLAPGLWDKIDADTKTLTFTPKVKGKSYPARPAVHHQKLVIVDGKYAFTGGVNLTADYVDKTIHDKPVKPWHDVFVKVEGSFILRDFVRNYVGLWNQERDRMEAFLKAASSAINIKPAPTFRATTSLTVKEVLSTAPTTVPPKIPSQVHRTVSIKGTDKTGIPITVRKDVLEGYVEAIAQAESYIYLENQYFREQLIADAIIRQHKAKPDLRTILLLPKIIEEFLTSAGDPLSKHGAAIQFKLLKEMKAAIGSKLGLFALERKDKTLVYVHSKLFIIDDKFASIGSSNCNPRSFNIDTELDFTWYDPTAATQLRMDLWNEALGKPPMMNAWKPKGYITKWDEIAEKNARAPAARKGFVIPFENTTEGELQLLLQLVADVSAWV